VGNTSTVRETAEAPDVRASVTETAPVAAGPAADAPGRGRGPVACPPLRPRDVGPGPFGLGVKRAFDLIVSVSLLAPAAPVGAGVAVAIKRSSPGPVFFWQTRVGFRGEHFRILKFRTMVHDADARKGDVRHLNESDGLFKIRADPRVTGVGRFLRQSYLDELPQLINVLKGEMSLVGPRPLIPEEDAAVKGSGRQRLQVPPGITGEWQLLRGGGASMDEMIAMDYRYVAGWNLWRDIRCLIKTAMYMFGRKGW
jgi:lipopolysaccharide/colanic/teichoic acid biosynthesis glycosyltransferase